MAANEINDLTNGPDSVFYRRFNTAVLASAVAAHQPNDQCWLCNPLKIVADEGKLVELKRIYDITPIDHPLAPASRIQALRILLLAKSAQQCASARRC